MIVISNSSPLIAVSCLQRLDIFFRLFGHLHIPHAVYQEVVVQCPDPQERQYIQHAVDEFMSIESPKESRIFSRNLGMGEREVLNLGTVKKGSSTVTLEISLALYRGTRYH